MSHKEPPFTVGIEEEYLLVDRETGEVDGDPPAGLLKECTERGLGQISPEFLRSQISVSTRVCRSMDEVRADLARLRGIVVEVAGRYGLAPIAASTHPTARATTQKQLICGMRVHVGIDDDDLRIDLMNQLSCSSPFWEGEKTGLMSYRLAIYNSLPRTGLPERFESYLEFRRHIDTLIRNALIEDTTRIWWDLRLSPRFPTLETRIMDCCTTLDDTICLAALNVSLARMLYRLRQANQSWRRYPKMLIDENRWRAMRYSFDEKLLDLAKGEMVGFATLLDELLDLVREDATALTCSREVAHARRILTRGTSAHRQLAVYDDARAQGASDREALKAVIRFLIDETAAGAAS